MRKLMVQSLAIALFMAVASVAHAHGGQYNGPGGGGTGDGFLPGGGGASTPGAGPGGGATPGQGGTGSTPGTGGSGSTPGAGPARPGGTGAPAGGAPGAGGATPGGKKASGSDQGLTWDAWWFFNDDKYLNLKAKLRRTAAQTDSTDDITGENPGAGDVVNRVPVQRIQAQVVPALKLALQDAFFDARAAASIALGKCGAAEAVVEIKKTLTDENKQVAESACLALGILGAKEAIPDLIEIMKNSDKARKAFSKDGKDIPDRMRGFAALGLGLIGSRVDVSDTEAVKALLSMIKRDSKNDDAVVCPIVALGVMKAKDAVPALTVFLADEEAEGLTRAYAATTLGKIGDRAAIGALIKALKDKQNQVVQSAAIALGILATPEDVEVVKALQTLVKSVPDQVAKNYATIALGEIGGVENRNFLAKLLDDKSRFAKTYGAIALGVYSTKNDDKEVLVLADKILKTFKAERNPEERGAYAIALGLMKYEKAGPEFLAALEDGGQAAFRGHLCTGMGLLGYRDATNAIQEVVKEKVDVTLRRNAAIALGLLGDPSAVKLLEKEIADSGNSQAVHGAVTQGLGFIGDVSAVPTLKNMVTDTAKFQDATRAFAAVALGLLGDKDEIPVLSKISENNNYHSRTDAIAEVLTIL